MNKDELEKRIQLIDGQMERVKQDINNLNSHLLLLDGGKQEALHWLHQLAIKEANQLNENKESEVPHAHEQTEPQAA
ncbi:MAG TPA: hypothetical protein VGW78_07755 [Candidatus Babeliales bacterium]|jgi:hypothetical protein|nr:hypothetical protein [Candidatus Babeliales bacterium]